MADVKLYAEPQSALKEAQIVLEATTGHVALDTARMCKPFMKQDQTLIDLNASSPAVKRAIAAELDGCCSFIDGGIMASPLQLGLKTPIVLSGATAETIAKQLNSVGMNMTVLGTEVGKASAYKIIRSIFTKSVEASLIESLMAAKAYGISQEVFDSIVQLFTVDPIEKTLDLMVRSNVLHAGRRAFEVEEVATMEKQDRIDNTMAAAAAKKLSYLASLGVGSLFHGAVAETLSDSVNAYYEAAQI